ncbi:secreted protein [Melampsora americana]|nr:secreted protein [Melampsora americana]
MKTSTLFFSTLVIFAGLLSNTLALTWSKNFAKADINTLTPILNNMQTYLSNEQYGAIYDILGDHGSKKLVNNVFGGTTIIKSKQEFINAFAQYKQYGELIFAIDSAQLKSGRTARHYRFVMNGQIRLSLPIAIAFNADVTFAGKKPVVGQVSAVTFTVSTA